MTVNRITPGGVAEAAGVKEGFVLMRLGGHDLLKGQRSLKAAQEAIGPYLPGEPPIKLSPVCLLTPLPRENYQLTVGR